MADMTPALPEPLKITGPSFLGKRQAAAGPLTVRLWPTNRGVMSLVQVSRSSGIKLSTLTARIRVDEPDCPGLLDADRRGKNMTPERRRKCKPTKPLAEKKTVHPGRRSIESIPIGTWEMQYLAGHKQSKQHSGQPR